MDEIVGKYQQMTPNSRIIFNRGAKTVPGAVGSSMHLSSLRPLPYPMYIEKAEGAHIFDVDNNDYIDYRMGYGAVGLFGHGQPLSVMTAVKDQFSRGILWGMPSEGMLAAAEMICRLVPSAQKVAFQVTGTEADVNALKLARTYTGKRKFIKFEGAFHGTSPEFYFSCRPTLDKAGSYESPNAVPESEGMTGDGINDIVVVPFNDLEVLERKVSRHKDGLAAIFMEPILLAGGGVIPPNKGFLEGVRKIATENNIVLVFDEVLSGFRLSAGGAQKYYGVTPDLSVMGKLVASGFPTAIICGKSEIMDLATPLESGARVPLVGTFTANPVSATAMQMTLKEISADPTLYNRLADKTETLAKGFRDEIADLGIDAKVQSAPGVLQVFFLKGEIRNYRDVAQANNEAYDLYYLGLLNRGVLFWGRQTTRQFVSTAHSEEDISKTIEISRLVLAGMRSTKNIVSKPPIMT